MPMTPRTGLLCVLLCLTLAVPVFAQDFRGGITGRVTDSTGAVLPGVTITATNVQTNGTSVVVTDTKGFYQIVHLNSGPYSVEATLEGFKPAVRKGITVHIRDAIKLDVALQPGGMEEVTVVTAAAPQRD